jgi:hypothetical protein
MLKFLRAIRFVAVIAAAAAVLVTATVPSNAQTGSVRIRVTKAGFIVGVGGGSGTLVFRGQSYPLRVSGISVGTIGIASADLVGFARNLRSPADIAGPYSAVGASAAIVGGAKVAHLRNTNGVILDLHGAQVGLELSLNLSGMTIDLVR